MLYNIEGTRRGARSLQIRPKSFPLDFPRLLTEVAMAAESSLSDETTVAAATNRPSRPVNAIAQVAIKAKRCGDATIIGCLLDD
jgi:hypothetical protein